jgi:hypothetical protein
MQRTFVVKRSAFIYSARDWASTLLNFQDPTASLAYNGAMPDMPGTVADEHTDKTNGLALAGTFGIRES